MDIERRALGGFRILTLVAWFQLGEFRLCAVGDSSDNGRGIELAILFGDEFVEVFGRRSGCTYERGLVR
jgi:hypothetical protein